MGLRGSRLVLIDNEIKRILKERKDKSTSIVELAIILGYAAHYFKYSILKYLIMIDPCIKVEGEYITLTCEE